MFPLCAVALVMFAIIEGGNAFQGVYVHVCVCAQLIIIIEKGNAFQEL